MSVFSKFSKKLSVITATLAIIFQPLIVTMPANAATDTIAGWNFTAGNATASSGIPANSSSATTATSVSNLGFGNGYGYATSWDTNDYWQINFSSSGYNNLTLSSKQYSSDNGPRYFDVQYKIGSGGAWTDIPSGSIDLYPGSTWTNLSVSLPSAANNNSSVYIRWYVTQNKRADGSNGSINSSSNSRIDDILVSGTAVDVTPPTLNLTSNQTSPTKNSPIHMTAVFSESVVGYDSNNVGLLLNGTVSNFTGSGANYGFDINPSAQGMVILDLSSISGVTDITSNPFYSTDRFTIVYDSVAPTVVSVDSTGKTFNIGDMPSKVVKVTFSENITNIPIIGVNPPPVENQTVNNCGDADAKTFCFTYTIVASQETTHRIYVSGAQDLAGNTMSADSSFTFDVDTITPTITINNPDSTPAQSKTITASLDQGTLTQFVTSGSACDDSLVFDTYSLTTFSSESDNGKKICYRAIDTAGNKAFSMSNTISGIDTTSPIGTVSYDKSTLTNTNVIATLNPSETVIYDSVGGNTHTFTSNGSFTFNFHDAAGNTGSATATVDWIDKEGPETSYGISGGTKGNNDWYIGSVTPEITLSTEPGAYTFWCWNTVSDCLSGGTTDQHPAVTNGINELQYYSVDMATNEESPHHFVTVKYDGSAPIISLLGNSTETVAYGDTYIDAGATASDTNDGDLTSSIITNNNVDTSDAGQYIVTYNVSDSAGNQATTITRIINVVPRGITVNADTQTKVYGEIDPDLTYQITSGSLATGDEFTGKLEREVGENIGTYEIKQGTLAMSDNYDLTFVSDDFIVTPAQITVTINNASKVFGAKDPTFTYKITSGKLIGDDKFTGNLDRADGEAAGQYEISKGDLTLGDNYEITFKDGILTILAAPAGTVLGTTTANTSSTPVVSSSNETLETADTGETLGTETQPEASSTSIAKADTSDKKDDSKKSTNFFTYTILGVYSWIWLLIIVAGLGIWWFLYRRSEEK